MLSQVLDVSPKCHFLAIGEAIRRIQGRLFDDLIITIVEEDDIEERWKLEEPFISKTAKV